MAILITDDGQTLKVVVHGADPKYINKEGLDVSIQGDFVILQEDAGNQYKFKYTDVSTPSSASAAALASTLQGYLDTASPSYQEQVTGNTYAKYMLDMSFGQKGYRLVTDTTAITGVTTGTYYCAVFPETSVINLLTITGNPVTNENGESVPANHVIFGDITAFALTSGSARLYKK